MGQKAEEESEPVEVEMHTDEADFLKQRITSVFKENLKKPIQQPEGSRDLEEDGVKKPPKSLKSYLKNRNN